MKPLLLGLLLWVHYTLLSVNTRAVAQGRYIATGITNAVIALCGFTLFKLITEASTPMGVLGYTIGGVIGGATGIWITRHWKER